MVEIETTLKSHGYVLGNFVGRGATSDCFIVKSLQFKNTDFACKVISLLSGEYSRSIRRHFEQEVSLISKLDHQNIIRCYDFFEDGINLYIIMEYCAKGNLASLIQNQHGFLLQNFSSYALQMINALAYCHELGVAHLDIKPANIFLTKYNSIRLSDFGSSSMYKEGETIDGRIGTRFFMAPEVGMKCYDPFKADIYSFGMTLLFCHERISYSSAQKQGNFYQFFLNKCSQTGPYESLIRACLSINPQDRPTAAQLQEMIMEIDSSEKCIHFKESSSLISNHKIGVDKSFMRLSPQNKTPVHKTSSMRIIHPSISHSRIRPQFSLQIPV